MKKIVILWFCGLFMGYSQMIVNDPVANASLAESLANGAQQLENGIEQLKFLKKAAEVLEKVNESLTTLEDIETIYRQQKSLYTNSKMYLKTLQETQMFSSEEIRRLTQSSISILNHAGENIKFLNKILKDGIFNMQDSDRIRFIKQQREEMEEAVVNLYALYLSAKSKAEKRAMLQLFKSN
ncbi:hypothetical protein ACILDU_11210 [Capnocytophaga canimorsus]|uniref:hypothetical protein n=1 Tax=Capnocytophaga canimorsus TaxID=28188 RepID=UPI0037CE1E7A